jgi:hypothetical protein
VSLELSATINNSHIADFSLSPAKIFGTAATLGDPNVFTATQTLNAGATITGFNGDGAVVFSSLLSSLLSSLPLF